MILKPLAVMTGLSLSALAVAADSTPLSSFITDTKTFSAQFDQKLVNVIGDVVEDSSGEFFLERPNKFRWNYSKPIPQEIIADGKNLWVFDKELEQVTVNAQSQTINPASAALLAGDVSELESNFTVAETKSSNPAEKEVLLTAKDEMNEYKSITLTFRGEQLSKFALKDSFGQTTLIEFNQIKVNDAISPSVFDFKPPAGVDVVKGAIE